jgi:signal peptidase I
MPRLRLPRPESGLGAVVELIAIVLLAIGLALLIQAYAIKPYQIPSASMEPTLDIGQRVLVNRFIYHLHDPGIGDIVVFHPPTGATGEGDPECADPKAGQGTQRACDRVGKDESDQNFIKRIVAGPGDKLSIKDGHPVVNGKIAREDFINPCHASEAGSVPCNMPKTITIPEDDYFMMGDNRSRSDDSRLWGLVPRSWIIGEAFFTYWPPDRIGFL